MIDHLETCRPTAAARSPLGAFGGVALLLLVALAVSGTVAGRSELAAWLSEPAAKLAQSTVRTAQAATLRAVPQARRQEDRPVPSRAEQARAMARTHAAALTGITAIRGPAVLLRPGLLDLPPPRA